MRSAIGASPDPLQGPRYLTLKRHDEARSEPFRKHYEDPDSQWGNTSGPGSDSFHTAEYRSFLGKFICLNSIRSVVDVGCGDWQSSRFIDFGGARYTGFDVVESVIARNNKLYGNDLVGFHLMPSDMMSVQAGDLLIMKDVLQHLSDQVILRMQQTLFPKFRNILLVNSYRKLDTPQNIDIDTGSFRCLDLKAAPYSFPGVYLMEYGSPVWERVRVFLYRTAI